MSPILVVEILDIGLRKSVGAEYSQKPLG